MLFCETWMLMLSFFFLFIIVLIRPYVLSSNPLSMLQFFSESSLLHVTTFLNFFIVASNSVEKLYEDDYFRWDDWQVDPDLQPYPPGCHYWRADWDHLWCCCCIKKKDIFWTYLPHVNSWYLRRGTFCIIMMWFLEETSPKVKLQGGIYWNCCQLFTQLGIPDQC